MLQRDVGAIGDALASYERALSLAPDSRNAGVCGWCEGHNNLGVLQRDVGAIRDALASYERALSLAPDSRNAGVCG
ncbi:hypothetical protein OEZ86_008701 [Tetradesmus obliquus]|nr:hypothetical protein OEZ86_008701 [Tetradesmus obliquus]